MKEFFFMLTEEDAAVCVDDSYYFGFGFRLVVNDGDGDRRRSLFLKSCLLPSYHFLA